MEQPASLLTTPVQVFPPIPSRSPGRTECRMELLEEADRAVQSRYPKMKSFLLAVGGELIYEKYYHGHHAGALNDLRSATKSFTSVLYGMAAADGLLPPADSPMLTILEKYTGKRRHPLLDQITFRHLLTMTSGFAWKTGKKLGEPLIHQFHRNRNWVSFALSLPVMEDQIGTFQYRSTDSHLLSVAVSEAVGSDAYAYAMDRLFGPLEITHSAWTPSPEGHSMGHVGLYLTSRDMIKFGLLCLNKGKWEGRRLIPPEWLDNALSPQTEGYPAYGDYGYQWWTGKIDGQDFSLAHGHGGQQIYLFPGLDAVIVFTQDSHVSRWRNPRMLVEKYILKAINTADKPADQAP